MYLVGPGDGRILLRCKLRPFVDRPQERRYTLDFVVQRALGVSEWLRNMAYQKY